MREIARAGRLSERPGSDEALVEAVLDDALEEPQPTGHSVRVENAAAGVEAGDRDERAREVVERAKDEFAGLTGLVAVQGALQRMAGERNGVVLRTAERNESLPEPRVHVELGISQRRAGRACDRAG